MHALRLWCAAALLVALVIAGDSANQNAENSPNTERKTRYQRKVLVSRSPVTTPAPTPAPAPAQATRAPKSTGRTRRPTPAQSTPTPVKPIPPIVASENAVSAENARATRNVAETARERLVRYVSDYVKGAHASGDVYSIPDWLKNPIKVDIPVDGESGGRGRSSTVPVFVLPIPVRQECSADQGGTDKADKRKSYLPYDEPRRPGHEEPFRPAYDEPRRPSYDEPRRPIYDEPRRPSYDEPRRPVYDEPRRPSDDEPFSPAYEKPRRPVYEEPRRPTYEEPHRPIKEEPRRPIYEEPRRPSKEEPRRPTYEEPRRPTYEEPRRPTKEEPRRPTYEEPHRPTKEEPRRPTYQEPSRPAYEEPRRPIYDEPRPYQPSRPKPFSKERVIPPIPPPNMNAGGPVKSDVLVALFRAQQPKSPELPAVLIRHRRNAEAPPPLPPVEPHHEPPAGLPPKPVFDRPLAVRGSLTVFRADYTEDYTAWWDPVTGNSRVDFADGATNTYRTMKDGRVKRVALSYDRTGEQDVRRCSVMKDKPATEEDYSPPMLPDMKPFLFSGYVQLDGTQAEQWDHTVIVGPERAGGSREESLTYRHEMLLARCNGTAKPIKYSVTVDSSVLGARCDRYEHRYHEVHHHQPDPGLFNSDTGYCDVKQDTDDMSMVEPLREFTMAQRDTRYDDLFKQFTNDFGRKYIDSTEETVRKNLLTQNLRFISAGNRLGGTFEMSLNFLSDRLDAEVDVLLGVELGDENFPAESFPHERSKLRAIADELPDEFDWRPRGAVSPVKYQGSCSSCWAFAVAGAVEGALFRKTRRLVPLSEQCLVDCSQPYGGNGCKGTWPSHAYDYVQDRGLAAEKEYIPYMERVLECQDKVVKPVTQISAHVNVTQHSVPALKVAIRRHAPSVVIIDAALKSFISYKTGVFYDDRCAKVKKGLKHAVLAVGWGQQRGEPYFILKNSWSAAWGEGGYIRMHGPSNTCGVLTLPSYPRLETSDVLRDLEPLASPAPASARSDDADDEE